MIAEGTNRKRLYRSRTERNIAGVAGGLGQYFNFDPVLIRLAFVFLALTTGAGLLIYIIMAIVVPERPVAEEDPAVVSRVDLGASRDVLAYLLVGIGVLLLAGNFGYLHMVNWAFVWPLVLIGLGAYLILKRRPE